MANSRVKPKFPSTNLLIFLAVLTAFLSGMGWLPSRLVEAIYAHRIYPTISHIAGLFADSVPFSWLDLWILLLLAAAVYSIRRRSWRFPLRLLAIGYLIFFWGWGLNYHRVTLATRLGLEQIPTPDAEQQHQFVLTTAGSLNRVWPTLGRQNSTGVNAADISLQAD